MMFNTIIFFFLLITLIALMIYFAIKGDPFLRRRNVVILSAFGIALFVMFLHTGPGKLKSDLTRIFNNSRPKSPEQVYSVLFGRPVNTCVRIVNFEDQVIPKIDCCIWIEVSTCPSEINRISGLRPYTSQSYATTDSSAFLKTFPDRPKWWLPQRIPETIIVWHHKTSESRQQHIIFNSDSTHAFVCDMAI